MIGSRRWQEPMMKATMETKYPSFMPLALISLGFPNDNPIFEKTDNTIQRQVRKQSVSWSH
jgi:hypothetical protein